MAPEPAKVVGELADGDDVGVLGRNTATSGEAIGVRGETASPEGYGLYTDSDAYVGETLDVATVRVDALEVGGHRIYVGSTEPTDPDAGDVWLDTSQ